jgi:uncharacterized protein (TIGR02246 family)
MAMDDGPIRSVYAELISGWNHGDANAMTRDFAGSATMIGFDGSQIHDRDTARTYLAGIFADHQVASFVTLIREVREIAPGVALLRAEVGMVPPGQSKINPKTNAVQTLVAVQREGHWEIELFQNTPAAWHGREADVERLTAELQAAWESNSGLPSGRP